MTQKNLKSNPNNSSLLKEVRISKGLTLEIVHEATKIPMDALRAIEEGYSTSILTPFYYRGFVKIYSEFLGLNTAEVLKEYNVAPVEIKTMVKPVKSPVKPAAAPVKPAAPVTSSPVTPSPKPAKPAKIPNPLEAPWYKDFLSQVQRFGRKIWTAKTRMILLRVVAAVVALFILVKIGGCAAGAIKSMFKGGSKTTAVAKAPKAQKAAKKEQPKEQPKQEAASEDEEERAAKDTAKTVSAQSQNHKVTLAVHAAKDTSIQVKSDGKVVFQMTMKKGTIENWEADNQIELSGRNIGDLELEVNGKDVSPLSSSNRRVRRVVITKDGLTVKK